MLHAMRITAAVLSVAIGLVAGQISSDTSGPSGILGFNSGAFFPDDDETPKKKSDFLEEFEASQSLHGSPGLFNSVRLYTNVQWKTTSDPIEAFEAAIETNTTMLLGVWCSGTDSIESELTALQSALDSHGSSFADLVVGISVGSEDLYRISETGVENEAGTGTDAKAIAGFISDVRAAINGTLLEDKMVGHVDAWSAWGNSSNKAVVDAVDFVGVDLYPYYEKDKGNSFDNSTNVYDYIYGIAKDAAGDKPLWITETGYPVSGPTFGEAETSVQNAGAYWQNIGCDKLFGRENVWWYNLRDSNPANEEKFGITEDLDAANPVFNLTCAAGSGAPATINTEDSSANRFGTNSNVAMLVAIGVMGLMAVIG
ncbi:murein transglycosylase [Zalerion maritima]|uniref:Murein transglycosylase n=1 Tax=Zalerion maritima TaxID=339359 RepID=A0AAD5RWJ1_9PEZI|nr:murein transglycosylase [Zalerion maritima]